MRDEGEEPGSHERARQAYGVPIKPDERGQKCGAPQGAKKRLE
jgi:hypothetical protein